MEPEQKQQWSLLKRKKKRKTIALKTIATEVAFDAFREGWEIARANFENFFRILTIKTGRCTNNLYQQTVARNFKKISRGLGKEME